MGVTRWTRTMAHRFSLTCALVLMLAIRECYGNQCSSHVVIIDASVDRPCKDLDFTSGDTVTVEQICSDLQSVLLLIAEHSSSSSVSGNTSLPCTELRVAPGDYVLTEVVKIVNHNVVIRAAQPTVTVQFDMTKQFDARDAVLSVRSCDFVELSGISFRNSPGIIDFENVSQVNLSAATFSYFSQGAVDIFNCQQVYATRCVFEHNGPVQTPRNQTYRGQAGGLNVGYNYPRLSTALPPRVIVSDCVFYNNTAEPPLSREVSLSNFLRNIFTGRGGACSLILRSLQPFQVVLERCQFEKNRAAIFGGAAYILTEGLYSVTMNSTRFIASRCPGTGGGIFFNYGQTSDPSFQNTFTAYDMEFVDNAAGYGGGIFMLYGGKQSFNGSLGFSGRFSNITFRGNVATEFGGGFACTVTPSSSVVFESKSEIEPLEFENCSFIANNDERARGGALSTAILPIRFSQTNTFRDNRGQALVIAGALVDLHGTLEIINNDATGSDQGAIYVTSFGQMELTRGAALRFINNQGNLGASVVLRGLDAVPGIFSNVLFNPLCFFLFENRTASPLSVDDNEIEISFNGNTAVIGSAIYTRHLALCSWIQLREPHFNTSASFRWSFMHYSADNCNSAHVGDECNPKWHVQTPAVQLNITSEPSVSAYPGEEFSVGIELYDELGELTADVLRLSDETLTLQQNESQDDILALNSSAVSYDTIGTSGVGLSFNSLQQTSEERTDTIFVNSLFTRSRKYFAESFEVVTTACPAGYLLSPDRLQPSSYRCQCNLNNTDIVNCDGRNIQLLDGLWAMVANESGEHSLATYQCPYQYCRCTPQTIVGVSTCSFIFSELDTDAQCICNREGVLCGDCRDGRGVSVQLNRCVSCHNAYSVLIALLVVCDVVVLVALLLLLSEMPAWLYPCLFYLQMLQYLTDSLLERFQQPIYTVTGALSFYFVYDFCVYSSLSPLVSYFIRFIPFLIYLLVCPIVIVVRNRCLKIPKRGGLWWILLLQYPHVVYTAMSVLNCPRLPGKDKEYALRWYVSGGVECFTGWHIPLAVLAVAVLLLCVALVPLILLSAFDKCPHRLQLFTNRLVLLTAVKYKWWGAVELCRRLAVILFIVAFPGNEFPVLLVLMLIIVLYGLVQPFTGKAGTALEAFLSVTTLLLLLLRNTRQATDTLGLKEIALPDSQGEQECVESVQRTARLTWLLFPLYYIPLVTLIVAVCWWTIIRLWHALFNLRMRCAAKRGADPLSPALLDKMSTTDYRLLSIGTGVDEGSIQLDSYRVTGTDDS